MALAMADASFEQQAADAAAAAAAAGSSAAGGAAAGGGEGGQEAEDDDDGLQDLAVSLPELATCTLPCNAQVIVGGGRHECWPDTQVACRCAG
jgi:hypothetical protein